MKQKSKCNKCFIYIYNTYLSTKTLKLKTLIFSVMYLGIRKDFSNYKQKVDV